MSVATRRFTLRPMTVADIPQVTAIERASFPTAWPQTAYRRELEQNNLARYIVAVEHVEPDARPPAARRGLLRRWLDVLLRALGGREERAPAPEERVVGFLGLWYMVDEAHIVSVATHPERRRRGIGEMLVAEALDLARTGDARTVTLEVRVSNIGAQALYEKYGFLRAGIRKRYYTDNGEDAVIMTTPPLDDPAYQARLAELARERAERAGR